MKIKVPENAAGENLSFKKWVKIGPGENLCS